MSIFICPVCGQKLDISGNSYICPKRHSFDRAKSGYVNLLLSKHMGKTVHGDNKLMVQARRNFLDKGYYKPLCDALRTAVTEYFSGGTIIDAGCGEGYYTGAIIEQFKQLEIAAEVCGIDISKAAVEYCAKRCRDAELAVASVFHIPVSDGSCDMLVTLFAPYCGEEFRRVLKKGGIMIMAIPSAEHLWELKQAVYDTPYKNEVKPYELEGFEFLSAQKVTYDMKLESSEDIMALFSMTPYYYRTGRDQQERLNKLDSLSTKADFELLVYRNI
ncbi:putative RNA methyltransferase [Ruminococcus sp.]|uniref:putative RNA methyltransferase n=1 Tax=Ruminococcus sp. TaxID=41978 RepID=UPI002C7329FE|nr:methyltransferase domain-containing protein [Ruminococcus sp.]HNZ98391.1 methyltransferase domain-containing protein [Ruminococcus sp.]HOH88194.1 methyltransferase domain-containing protein [Ruminococcus sp.]